jgi:hypothetical protein
MELLCFGSNVVHVAGHDSPWRAAERCPTTSCN